MLICTLALLPLKTLSSFGIKVDALKSFNDVDETVCLDPAPRIEGSSRSLTVINCS